ncbi:hypothetical protein [Thiolinea disciformis]|nr:hypothetical protein [Thiolinea disciformis]
MRLPQSGNGYAAKVEYEDCRFLLYLSCTARPKVCLELLNDDDQGQD